MSIKDILNNVILRIPYIGKWREVFLKHSTPGTYGSPVPDISFLKSHYSTLESKWDTISNINFNNEYQLSLFSELKKYFSNFNFPNYPNSSHRFYTNNIYYNKTDALILFSLILSRRPKRIIEIGSGYSSALILDINELFFNNEIELTFIEPNPTRLKLLLKGNEKYELIENQVQFANWELFDRLTENDILFVDSSHISKALSDVNHILFNILPKINKGVLIHFHDIYENFEYPLDIVDKGYYWNEAYLLRAFLMYNDTYSIELINSTLHKHVSPEYVHNISKYFILDDRNIYTGGFWMKKIK